MGSPQIELYPATKYGKKGYLRLRKKGLRPKGGRRAKYTWRGPGPAVPETRPLPPPIVKPKEKIGEKPPAKPSKVLKVRPKPVVKPETAKVILVPKEQIEKRKAEGYKLIREIDGKFMMEKPK